MITTSKFVWERIRRLIRGIIKKLKEVGTYLLFKVKYCDGKQRVSEFSDTRTISFVFFVLDFNLQFMEIL